MAFEHEDAAVTIEPGTARELLARATPRGRRLLEIFARRQLVSFSELRREFGATQNGLNALLGHLTRDFQEIQGAPGFYIYLPRLPEVGSGGGGGPDRRGGWAIGHASGVNLRRAIKADERSRQGKFEFPRQRG